MFATSKEMAKIVTKQQNDLFFGRRKVMDISVLVSDRHTNMEQLNWLM
jgi:hypothetical protein